jgi:hypothetical protein
MIIILVMIGIGIIYILHTNYSPKIEPISYLINKSIDNHSVCNYNDPSKSYIKKEPNCVINFACIRGMMGFSDSCGCGCEKIVEETEINCSDFSYEKCPKECSVCPPCEVCSSVACRSKDFCRSIGFNDTWYKETQDNMQIVCTKEQRNIKACPEMYGPVCGWFNQTIKCFKYPCAQVYDNPCFACSNPTVEYYTPGACPK